MHTAVKTVNRLQNYSLRNMNQHGLCRIVIIEDDNLIRESFVTLINENEKFICIADYDTCEEAITGNIGYRRNKKNKISKA